MTALASTADNDLDVMARTLWAEARGETYPGMIAVAWVIRNRVEDRRWLNTVHGVCRQKWQFSCWNGETIGVEHQDSNYRAMVSATLATPFYLRALSVAAGVLAGDLPNAVADCCHYHADSVMPSWAVGHAPWGAIGRHVFYNDVP